MDFARRGLVAALTITMFLVVACEAGDATPTPRPTWTPRAATATSIPINDPAGASGLPITTPPPTSATKPGATATTQAAPRIIAPGAADPLLPKFGPFPPLAIPARPANINPLTGLTADPAMLQRRPIVGRIGNDQIVRTNNWHAGLSVADLVFEELIDILGSQYANTRYSAVFLSNDPPLIGPIRSQRIINFQIVPMLNGALASAGGSNGTRWLFSQTPIVNLDEGINSQPAFCYMDIKNRSYQARLYTTGPRIREFLKLKGLEAPVQLYGFTFADRASAGTPATNIGLNKSPWPSWATVQWQYDAASGKYSRFTINTPHMDTLYSVTAKWGNGADCVPAGNPSTTQIKTSNIVVLYAKYEKTEIIEDDNNAVSAHITLTGQGDAAFFRDGVMVQGKWQRQSEQEFFRFTDNAGNTYNLKPGNTWFEIVPLGYQLDVK